MYLLTNFKIHFIMLILDKYIIFKRPTFTVEISYLDIMKKLNSMYSVFKVIIKYLTATYKKLNI